MSEPRWDVDVVVVGSGFGGSVAALRLADKGYAVRVYEAGRRFADSDFARTSWDVRRYLWAPALKCFGVQRIHRLRDVMILAGAGVGGGSLNYANTLYVPPPAFFEDPQWAHITDWQSELAPHYETASRMLGVVTNPCDGPVEQVMRAAATDLGVEASFRHTPVGVFLGEPGVRVADPYFGGAGPERTGCTMCGNCMVGCRDGAKNTLVKNYLWLAERRGATIEPMRTVDRHPPPRPAAPGSRVCRDDPRHRRLAAARPADRHRRPGGHRGRRVGHREPAAAAQGHLAAGPLRRARRPHPDQLRGARWGPAGPGAGRGGPHPGLGDHDVVPRR